MSVLQITLFGRFSAERDGEPLSGFGSQKVQELFSYLLLHRDRPHPREMLASLLWDHCSTAQSRMYLRRVLWKLQHALSDEDGEYDTAILHVGTDWIQINSDTAYWLDVAVFEETYDTVRGTAGHLLSDQDAQRLEDAAALYRSDLLENFYQEWCLDERARLQHIYMGMLDKLMDHCQAHRRYEQGLEHGKRILQVDRAREHTHRRMMRLFYLAGSRTDALRQYEQCAAVLNEELDVTPSRRTVTLYEQIRADQVDGLTEELADGLASGLPGGFTQGLAHGLANGQEQTGDADEASEDSNGSAVSLPEQLDQIRNFQKFLADVQGRIQREIEAIEDALYRGT